VRLYAERDHRPLSVCIRERSFGEDAALRERRGNNPVQNNETLGRVMGALGGSRLSSDLNQLAKAVNTKSLPVTPENKDNLNQACRDVADMRGDLRHTLGKAPGHGP